MVAIVIHAMERRQAAQFRHQIQSLQQQQTAQMAQIRQMEQERNDAMDRLVSIQMRNESLEATTNLMQLLRLRGEASRLEANEAARKNDPTDSGEDAWLARVKQLKQYVQQHPNEAIPELQFLGTREWLVVTALSNSTNPAGMMLALKIQAGGKFATAVSEALKKYAMANNGQFPDDLSELQPYDDVNVEEILQQRYEIKPVNVLSQGIIHFLDLKNDRVIASRFTFGNNSTSHLAIFPGGGYTYF